MLICRKNEKSYFWNLRMLDQDKRTGKYLRWEYLKYLKYLKNKDRNFLEKELKNLEKT